MSIKAVVQLSVTMHLLKRDLVGPYVTWAVGQGFFSILWKDDSGDEAKKQVWRDQGKVRFLRGSEKKTLKK